MTDLDTLSVNTIRGRCMDAIHEFADKLLSAMRSEFGGHIDKRSES